MAWQVRAGRLTLAATGGAAPEETAEEGSGLDALATRLPLAVGGNRRWTAPGEVAADGLPVVGRLAGPPFAVACGFGPLAVSLSFVAARWVADALLTSRDPTPRAFRAGRGVPDAWTV